MFIWQSIPYLKWSLLDTIAKGNARDSHRIPVDFSGESCNKPWGEWGATPRASNCLLSSQEVP